MTHHPDKPQSSARKEYLVLALIIVVGSPIAWYWGTRDGRTLAAKAYGTEKRAAGAEKAASAAQDEDDYEDEDSDAAAASTESPEASAAPASTRESIERGAALFKANCVACHGEKGDGKGPAAVAFTPPPRNFTDPNARWTRGHEPAQIFATITQGVEGTGMAGFGGALTEAQRWDLAHYVGSLVAAAGAGKGTP